jgi:hypothetical protein
MGLALRLLPIDKLIGTWGSSFNVLELGGISWDFAPKIQAFATLLPPGHDIHAWCGTRIKTGAHKGEHVFGKLDTDCYGERYTWITARDLLPFLLEHWSKHPATAYVRALPEDRWIVLDWH